MIAAAVAVPVAFGVRSAVAAEFYATTDVVAPAVPRDSRVLVYKWASAFRPGDIIAYRAADGAARVVSADAAAVTVSRAGEPSAAIPRGRVVGRVVLGTR